MLSNSQLEWAAREYCQRQGIDPEEQTYMGPLGVLCFNWQKIAETLRIHEAITEIMEAAKQQP